MPPEWIFDTGLGELFVIRVAATCSPEIAGTLQYGSYLETPLFVILGHEVAGSCCGAGDEARGSSFVLSSVAGRQHLPTSGFVRPFLPEEWRRAVESNVRWTVRQIRFAGRDSAHGREANQDRRRGLRDRNGSREDLPPDDTR